MYNPQIVSGPVAPLQVQGPVAYYPAQSTSSTSSWTDIINSFMPLIMMVAMMGMMIPLMGGLGGKSS